MTQPDPYDPLADALPGLALQGPQAPAGKMVEATRDTLAALADRGMLRPEHTALAQLALQLATAVEAATLSRRGSAVAMAARELREVLLALPQVDASTGPTPWDEFERAYREAG